MLTRRPTRLELAANLIGVLAVVGVFIHLSVWIPEMAKWERTDFGAFWSSGEPPFYGSAGRPNRNNPHTTFLLFGPFWSLPFVEAWIRYSAANVVAMVCAIGLMVRAVGASWWAVLPVFVVLVVWSHGFTTLTQGQVTGPLLLSTAAGWWGLERHRDGVAAVAFGVALAMKVFFALAVVCLWLAGKRRVAAIAALVAGVFYLVGFSIAPDLYVEHVRMLAEVEVVPDGGRNYSLAGTGSRFGWPLVWLVPVVAWAVLAGSRKAAPGLVIGLSAVGMLLLSPLGWFYYMPLGLIALLVAWRRGRPWIAASGWLIAGVPLFGMPTLGLLILLGVLLTARERRPSSPELPAPA